MKIETRMDHARVPAGQDNVVHLLVTLAAPGRATGDPRPRVNLAAVIDRSGSMAGKKLGYAKDAVRLLIDQLGPEDRFSLVAFDDEVLPLAENAGAGELDAARDAVAGIVDGGSTNLSGGWLKGIELAGRGAAPGSVNAVLLLTDGQANGGITDPDALAALGAGVYTGQGIRTSCLGLGADFSEDLLKGVAAAGGGRFYYIESPDQAPEVFKEELGGLLAVVAQNVEVELAFADGVSGVAQITGHPWKAGPACCRALLGDFRDRQVKHLLLAVRIPAVSDVTDMHLASMRVTYAELGEGALDIKSQKRNLVVRVVGAAEAARPADPEVLLHIGLQQAAQARRDAVKRIDIGDVAGAAKVLEGNRNSLRQMAPLVREPGLLEAEAKELDRRVAELREDRDVGDSRKIMVAEESYLSRSGYSENLSARNRRSRPPAGTADRNA